MSIALTNLVLWPFLFLVAVPLLLHLFARTKPPVYAFSSVEFILRILRATMRIKRPQDWVLLLVRTLAFAAILAIFLRPLLFSRGRPAGSFERKNVVLIVDATASMAYADGAQTRFAAACAEGSDVLSGLSARDSANIVWLDAAPDAVFPDMGVNLGYLQNALREARVTSEAGNIEEAVRMASRMLEGVEGQREICMLSDFQASAWKRFHYINPPGVECVYVKVGDAEAPNLALTDTVFDPPRPLMGEEVGITCEVRNYSSQPRRATVFLGVAEGRRSQEVMVPAWSKAVAVFRHRFTSHGAFPISASLDEDAFPGDDRRWSALPVRQFLNVGILAGEHGTDEARTWRRVLDAVGWAQTETLPGADISGEQPLDAILLAGWDGSDGDALTRSLEAGSTLVWFPAPDTPVARLHELAGAARPNPPPGSFHWLRSAETFGLKVVQAEDPAFRLFAAGEYGDPSKGVFSARHVFAAADLPEGNVLLAYGDGVPALVRFRNGGTLFLWNLPLAPELSNWASQTAFLPFLAELLLTSRAAPANDRATRDNVAGELLTRRLPGNARLEDVALNDREGRAVPIKTYDTDGGAGFASQRPPPPGLYTWQYRDKPLGYGTVNFPVVESDLRAMALDDMAEADAVAVSAGQRVRELRDGVSLWPYLLTAALALVLVEGTLLVWFERT